MGDRGEAGMDWAGGMALEAGVGVEILVEEECRRGNGGEGRGYLIVGMGGAAMEAEEGGEEVATESARLHHDHIQPSMDGLVHLHHANIFETTIASTLSWGEKAGSMMLPTAMTRRAGPNVTSLLRSSEAKGQS